MSEDEQRHRLVILGAGKVGKTSIVNRLLHGKFLSTYKPTVEDLHCRNFTVNGNVIRADILDTAGNLEFPAMRRLSISTAHAFLLVFALDDRGSFEEVKRLWEQIREQRGNYKDLPCVVAANKCDLITSNRLIALEEPEDWARSQGIETALVEVSAKDGENVKMIFRKLVQQASAASTSLTVCDDDQLLKRHCSANSNRLHPHMQRLREKEEEGLSRSRSLIRRVRKPKVHPPSSASDDCTIC